MAELFDHTLDKAAAAAAPILQADLGTPHHGHSPITAAAHGSANAEAEVAKTLKTDTFLPKVEIQTSLGKAQITPTPDGGLSLSTPKSAIDFDSEGRVATMRAATPGGNQMLALDHGRPLYESDTYENGASMHFKYSDGRLQEVELKGMGKSATLEFNGAGEASINGRPADQAAYDFQLTPDKKEHFVFDSAHKLASSAFSSPEESTVTTYNSGSPVEELAIDRKTGIPSVVQYAPTGEIKSIGTLTPEGMMVLNLDQGKIAGVSTEPTLRQGL